MEMGSVHHRLHHIPGLVAFIYGISVGFHILIRIMMMENAQTYWMFYLTLVAAAVLPKIPFIGRYFQVFNTLIHEDGHAIMALLSRGQIKRIELFADTSGTTITKA